MQHNPGERQNRNIMSPTFHAIFKEADRAPESAHSPEAHEQGWVEVHAGGALEAKALVESHYGENYEDILNGRQLSDYIKRTGKPLLLGCLGVIDSEYDGAPDESYPGQRAVLAADAERARIARNRYKIRTVAQRGLVEVVFIEAECDSFRYQVVLTPVDGHDGGSLVVGANAVITVLQPFQAAKAVTVFQGQHLHAGYIGEHMVKDNGDQHLQPLTDAVNAAIAACKL